VRANPKIAGTTHNVFGIQTGVAILFLVKSSHKQLKLNPCKIEYTALVDDWRKEEKLAWFAEKNLCQIEFDNITPDKRNNWINQSANAWDSNIPVCNKEVKLGRENKGTIFGLYTQGIKTNRNDWVYDFDESSLSMKVQFFEKIYNTEIERWKLNETKINTNDFVNRIIKWTTELETHMEKGRKLFYDPYKIVDVQYRPFIKLKSYVDRIITHRLYNNEQIFGLGAIHKNFTLFFSGIGSSKSFQSLVTNGITDYDFIEKPQGLPLYRYSKNGDRLDNITDWALEQ
jgi:predicted helicase